MLNGGLAVGETPAAVLVAVYLRGSGAATAKLLRLGGLRAMGPLWLIGRRWLLGQSAVTMGYLPARRVRLHDFLRGVRHGWQQLLDLHTGRFQPFPKPEVLLASVIEKI